MVTILQKAVLPGRVRSWAAGGDLLCGYVVNAVDVRWATTPSQLFEAHGLGFPGSPYTADSPTIDVLRFPLTPFVRLVNATGAPTDTAVGAPGEGFIDRPPFTGTGFAAGTGDHIVPVWWLEPTRVPAASELWRIHRDGREELLSAYYNVASGWQPSGTVTIPPSDLLGGQGRWRGASVLADPLPDGRIVIASTVEVAGLRLTERGLWAATVSRDDLSEYFAPRLTAVWHDLPFQIVRRGAGPRGVVARMVYLGRDSRAAEAAGLEKTDAAVYEALAPVTELTDVVGVQLIPT